MNFISRLAIPALIAIFAIAPSISLAQKDGIIRYTLAFSSLGLPNPVEVQSFSWGVSSPVSFSGGGGGAIGRPSLSSFNIMKPLDAYSGLIFDALTNGVNTAVARFEGFRQGSPPFLVIIMENALFESQQHSGSAGTMPFESVSLAFSKITVNGFTYDSQTIASNPNSLRQMVAKIIADNSKPATK